MGTSTCKSCGKAIHWIRTPLRPFNAVRHSAGKLPHKARRQHKAGNTCRGRDKLRNSGRSGRGSGLGLCATLEHLQRAGLVQKEVIMAKNRKRRRRQPPPLWQRRTCDTCASQKRCDDFSREHTPVWE